MSKAELLEQIREMILSFDYQDDRRLTEQDFVDAFGLSRTPIRDALKQLEVEGLIERKKNYGITLRKPELKEIAELYELRAVLEGHAAQIAATNVTTKDIDKLKAIVKRFTALRKKGQDQKAKKEDLDFHRYIINMSGNSMLDKVMERFSLLERVFLCFHQRGDSVISKELRPDHGDICDAVCSGDAALSEKRMKQHILNARKAILERAVGVRL